MHSKYVLLTDRDNSATDTDTPIISDKHDEPKKTEPEGTESHHDAMSKPDHPSSASTELGDYYFNYIMKSRVKPTDKKYAPFGAFPMELPGEAKWTDLVGEDLCIIDLDNRPFDEPGQIFSPNLMSWDRADETHGLSLGVLNHWLYGAYDPTRVTLCVTNPSQPRTTVTSTTMLTSPIPLRTAATHGRSPRFCPRSSRSTRPAFSLTPMLFSTTSTFPSSGS